MVASGISSLRNGRFTGRSLDEKKSRSAIHDANHNFFFKVINHSTLFTVGSKLKLIFISELNRTVYKKKNSFGDFQNNWLHIKQVLVLHAPADGVTGRPRQLGLKKKY